MDEDGPHGVVPAEHAYLFEDPPHLVCPLSSELFLEPVIARSGRKYEREAIVRWIRQGHSDPITRVALKETELTTSFDDKSAAESYRRGTALKVMRAPPPLCRCASGSSASLVIRTDSSHAPVPRYRCLADDLNQCLQCVSIACDPSCGAPVVYLRRASRLILPTDIAIRGLSKDVQSYLLSHTSADYDSIALR